MLEGCSSAVAVRAKGPGQSRSGCRPNDMPGKMLDMADEEESSSRKSRKTGDGALNGWPGVEDGKTWVGLCVLGLFGFLNSEGERSEVA